MSDLTVDGFLPFFAEVTSAGPDDPGHQPFAWQLDLVGQLLDGQISDVIDVPTGLGKTSLIACWVYALAGTFQRPAGPRLPRRLFFVVDRRLVVDGAFEDADALRGTLTDPIGPTCRTVAEQLVSLHGDPALPALTVVRMRGGLTWDARWLARPDQPAVIVGTVDQFGSRLLFRGYGTSPRMRPVDAALTGADSWLVIDEAHIAGPLVRTTRTVRALQQAGPRVADVPVLQVTQMSATSQADGTVLHADLDEQAGATALPAAAMAARARVNAAKPVTLVEFTDLAGASRKTWRRSAQRLGRSLAEVAMRTASQARVIGVIANTIGTARAAHEQLEAAGETALLLIGRTRAYERDALLASDKLARARVGAPRRADDDRLYVVATQTIEVGANLDLDLLVTECAPLSSLVQRFGRVNRLGRHAEHRSIIARAGFAHHEDDPVYGPATAATWTYLVGQTSAPVETTAKLTGFEWPSAPHLDIGLRTARALTYAAPDATRPSEPFVPTLLTAHVDRWAATCPAPDPDQDPTPFLHGVEYRAPQVAVAWRAAPPHDTQASDGPADDDHTENGDALPWRAWLELARPTAWEFVDVPIWEARAFLADTTPTEPTSDLDAARIRDDADANADDANADQPVGVVYRGPDEPLTVIHGSRDVRAGDRLIVDARIGGHDAWGWTGRRNGPDDPAVPDVADLAPGRRHPALRLSRSVLGTLVNPDRHADLDQRLSDVHDATDTRDVADRLETLLDLLPAAAAAPWAQARPDRWDELATGLTDHGLAVVLLTVARNLKTATDLDQTSDDDVVSTSLSRGRQTLADHSDDVGTLARALADRLGLDPILARAVETAACWHDLGKADPRFQLLLHDGDELAAAAATEPLAKSGRDPRDPVARRVARSAGVPRGFRHEAVSARLADKLIIQLGLDDELDTDLLLHLVVSHHGWARPLLPPLRDPDAPCVRVTVNDRDVEIDGADQLDWDQPGRFERLNTRYGPWGLALLEALVRLADMRCSERA